MSQAVPHFEIGKNYAVIMTPQNVDATTGAWSDNVVGALQFNGLHQHHSEETTYNDDNITPSDGPNDNPVTMDIGTTITISELLTKYVLGSTSGNKLRKATTTSIYQKIVVVEYDDSNFARTGSSGKLATTTYYCKLVGFSRDVPKGQVVATATFRTCLVPDGSGGYITNPAFS